MGRTSSKRKSSKIHSEARKKKRKHTSTKSKKLHSRKEYSSSTSDDSRISVSVSSSSSEDENYKSRSRRKSELKSSKKRVREKSSLKSDKVSKIKKPRKKKLKREPSFTSLSSDSRGGSINSIPSDNKEKPRKRRRKREPSIASIASYSISDENREISSGERFREKSKGERDLHKTKSLKDRARSFSPYDTYNDEIVKVRDRSFSSYNRYNDEIDYSVPIIPAENNSRRLRSVITVVKPPEDEERESTRDSLKEEMMQVDFEAREVGILKRDEALVSDLKSSEVIGGGGGEIINIVGIENKIKEVSPVLPNTENDLESVLRLKALENMIKYKGAQIEKLKAPSKVSSSKIEEQSRIQVTIKSEPSMIPKKTQKANLMVNENIVSENSAVTSQSVRIASNDGEKSNNITKSSISEPSIIPKKKQNATLLVSQSNMDNARIVTSENAEQASKNSERTTVRKSFISEAINNSPKKVNNANSSVADSTENNKSAPTSASPRQDSKTDEKDHNIVKSSISEVSSSVSPKLEENSSKEHRSTDKDGSEFEQKTMSVMRGGEMVQVSYKVYIPKKAPALARRPLKR